MARFHCEVLTTRGERVCAGMIDVRVRGKRRGPRSWHGRFVSFDDGSAVFSLEPGDYTFRLRDGSEHAARINEITIGMEGPHVGFDGASDPGPAA